MVIHIIPDTETELHEESADCICEPTLKMDEDTGNMVWAHDILDADTILKDIVKM